MQTLPDNLTPPLHELSQAVEQSAEAIFITDIEGDIQYVNPAFENHTGFTREEVIGSNPRILNARKTDVAVYRSMWKNLSEGKVWSGRFINKRKDGSLFEWESTISPIHSEAGQIVSYVAASKDITKEVQLEDQLRQAQKMDAIGRMASGISHDFNNLMSAIIAHVDVLLDDLSSENALYSEIELIRDVAVRGSDLTRQLLAFSRRQVMDPKILDLNELIRNTCLILRRVIGDPIHLTQKLASNLRPVRVDPVQITQVIMNLAINARDAMPDGGHLKIETQNLVFLNKDEVLKVGGRNQGPFALLIVSDTGMGMNEETQAHLFEPFFSTKTPDRGTGLGLATVYGIIRQSGGFIHVESKPEEGSVFQIYLPACMG